MRSLRRGGLGSLLELLATVAVAVGLAFAVQALLVKPYRIPSGSMEPTLGIDQRVLVWRLDTHPGLGQVVVFHPPAGADASPSRCGAAEEGFGGDGSPLARPCDRATARESAQTFVKRVVGEPGDVLRIHDGHVYRNGVAERDPYITPCGGVPECTFSQAITVPAGEYYMMGDNRGDSDDSRFWGPVPAGWIIGTAFFTYWPPDRLGTL